MRTYLTFAMVLLASQASAYNRYESLKLGCDQIHAIIESEKHVIFTHPARRTPGLMVFDHYVSGQFECKYYETTERTFIPGKDGQCPVLHCVPQPDPCDRFPYAPQCQ